LLFLQLSETRDVRCVGGAYSVCAEKIFETYAAADADAAGLGTGKEKERVRKDDGGAEAGTESEGESEENKKDDCGCSDSERKELCDIVEVLLLLENDPVKRQSARQITMLDVVRRKANKYGETLPFYLAAEEKADVPALTPLTRGGDAHATAAHSATGDSATVLLATKRPTESGGRCDGFIDDASLDAMVRRPNVPLVLPPDLRVDGNVMAFLFTDSSVRCIPRGDDSLTRALVQERKLIQIVDYISPSRLQIHKLSFSFFANIIGLSARGLDSSLNRLFVLHDVASVCALCVNVRCAFFEKMSFLFHSY
jgi:hypothetical protein